MGMRVKALQMGFYGGNRRREGQVFELADGAKVPSWAELVSGGEQAHKAKPTTKTKPKPEPDTFSELTPAFAKELA